MKGLKKALAIATSSVMIVGMLAGCGKDDGGVKGDVTWWTWSTEATDAFSKQIELAKTAKPDVNVNIEYIANADYWTKLPIAIAGGTGPDIYQMTRPSFELYAAAGQTADLTEAIANSEILTEYLNSLDPVLVDTYKFEEKQMGIPFSVESTAVAYNKTMFEAAGLPDLKEMEDTWTWEDLREIAKELTVKNSAGETEQYGFLIPADRIPVWELVWSHGYEMFNEEQTECIIGQAGAIEALEPLVDMYIQDGVSPKTDGEMSVSGDDLFISGKIGMVCAGIWKIPSYRNITTFEWDVVELPLDPTTGKRVTSSNVLGYMVNPNSKNMDATIAFLEELVKKESQETYAETGTFIPALESARDAYFDMDVPENVLAFNRALSYAHPNTLSQYIPYAQYGTELVNAMKNAYSGRTTTEEALVTMQDNINKVMQENMK